jgi:predicted DNA binding CopG/RHH family protein
MNMPHLAIRVSEASYEKIKNAAKRKNMSVAKFIRTIVQEELKKLGFKNRD